MWLLLLCMFHCKQASRIFFPRLISSSFFSIEFRFHSVQLKRKYGFDFWIWKWKRTELRWVECRVLWINVYLFNTNYNWIFYPKSNHFIRSIIRIKGSLKPYSSYHNIMCLMLLKRIELFYYIFFFSFASILWKTTIKPSRSIFFHFIIIKVFFSLYSLAKKEESYTQKKMNFKMQSELEEEKRDKHAKCNEKR